MVDPPSLPPRYSDPPVVITTGLVLAVAGALVALLVAPFGEVFWSCVAAVGVGAFGATVFTWQRAAARRGSRYAQSGLHDDG